MQSIRMKTRLTGRQKNRIHSLTTLANLKEWTALLAHTLNIDCVLCIYTYSTYVLWHVLCILTVSISCTTSTYSHVFSVWFLSLLHTLTHELSALWGRVHMHFICSHSSFQFCFWQNWNPFICWMHHTQTQNVFLTHPNRRDQSEGIIQHA